MKGERLNLADTIKSSVSIVDVACDIAPLQRSGGEYRGPCPIHGGAGPNFSVSPKRQVYHCHTCKAGGDAIDLVMEVYDCDFITAVEKIAHKYEIDVETEIYEAPASKQYLIDVVSFASDLWSRRLTDSDEAVKYLQDRDIPIEFAVEYGVGYCATDARELATAVEEAGLDPDALWEAGIVSDGQSGPFVRMRNRMTVTTRDALGRPVAFTGRTFGHGPKWMHTPDSPVYSRATTLFGFDRAKGCDDIVIVEGASDVLTLHCAGVEGAVGAFGTSLTEFQARMLSRYDKVTVLFDNDDAGRRASYRASMKLLEAEVQPIIARLEEGEDPGRSAAHWFKRKVNEAVRSGKDVVDDMISVLDEAGFMSSNKKRSVALKKLVAPVRAAKDSALKEIYAGAIANALGVRRDVVLDLSKDEVGTTLRFPEDDVVTHEEVAVSFCKEDALRFEELADQGVTVDDFRTSRWRWEWSDLASAYESDGYVKKERHVFTDDQWEDACRILIKRAANRQVQELRDQLITSDEEGKMKILARIMELKNNRQGLDK